MSEFGRKIPLPQAQALAAQVVDHLRPAVERIEVAGSVRRKVRQVGDIEIVLKPIMQGGLFGADEPMIDAVKHRLWEIGRWVRGGKRMMKITDLLGEKGVALDVSLVHPPSQWGTLFLIRTGSANFSQRVVSRLKQLGTPCRDGRVIDLKTGEVIATPEEEDVFRLARMHYVPPEKRW